MLSSVHWKYLLAGCHSSVNAVYCVICNMKVFIFTESKRLLFLSVCTTFFRFDAIPQPGTLRGEEILEPLLREGCNLRWGCWGAAATGGALQRLRYLKKLQGDFAVNFNFHRTASRWSLRGDCFPWGGPSMMRCWSHDTLGAPAGPVLLVTD